MQRDTCPNLNHSRTNPPVRYCPACGKVVNGNILAKKCNEEEHARKRLDRNKYCVDCGEQLIK